MKKLLFRRGFNDKLYYYNLRFAWWFTIVCFILTATSGYLGVTDMSVVSVGLPVVWGELGIHTGFIIWKAKEENCRKYKDVNNDELEEIEL